MLNMLTIDNGPDSCIHKTIQLHSTACLHVKCLIITKKISKQQQWSTRQKIHWPNGLKIIRTHFKTLQKQQKQTTDKWTNHGLQVKISRLYQHDILLVLLQHLRKNTLSIVKRQNFRDHEYMMTSPMKRLN